jgi:NADPH:quinone reductase-like Zn-dependent oxidoreductase
MFAVFASSANAEDPLSSLVIGERPLPAIPTGWLRVKVSAAGLNPHDLGVLRGMVSLHGKQEFPMILGCEGTGTLDDGTEVLIYPIINDPEWRGSDVNDPSRRAFGEMDQGTFAEYVVVPRRNALPLPKGLSSTAAAVLGASWLTAYRMLFRKSGLRPGQTMLVQGSAGGVSTALIQLGRAAGMQVWAAGRTEEKLLLAKRIGAHRTFLSGEPLPEKADAVFDTVGATTFRHSIQSVRSGGTVVICGASTGYQAEADLVHIFVEEISVRGVFAGTLDDLKDLMAFVVTAGIEPQVGRLLPMQQAKEGFRALLEGRILGKIVLCRGNAPS